MGWNVVVAVDATLINLIFIGYHQQHHHSANDKVTAKEVESRKRECEDTQKPCCCCFRSKLTTV